MFVASAARKRSSRKQFIGYDPARFVEGESRDTRGGNCESAKKRRAPALSQDLRGKGFREVFPDGFSAFRSDWKNLLIYCRAAETEGRVSFKRVLSCTFEQLVEFNRVDRGIHLPSLCIVHTGNYSRSKHLFLSTVMILIS